MSSLNQKSGQSEDGDVIGLLNTMKEIVQHDPPADLILITAGSYGVHNDLSYINPSSAPLWGMVLAFNNEHATHRSFGIDLEPGESEESWTNDVFQQLFLIKEKEHQIAFRSGTKYVKRLINADNGLHPLSLPNTERFCLQNTPTGSFSDFFISSDTKHKVKPIQVEVLVKCVALNFKDILIAMQGTDSTELKVTTKDIKGIDYLGVDFSGTVSAVGDQVTEFSIGDRVYGMSSEGAFKSHITVEECLLMKVPKGLSFEDASTVPTAFITAIYFLMDVGRLRVDDKLLLHTASGGVGLAAIQVARQVGCQLFVTAGSERKREYLRSLGLEHVYNSRNTDYAKQIMKDTNGVGVNIVLNSLTGPNFKESTLSICAPHARFLEMSKLNAWIKEEVNELRPDVFYFTQDIRHLEYEDVLLGNRSQQVKEHLSSISYNLEKGIFRPLPLSKFVLSRIPDAFKYLQDAKHIGKVVVKIPRTRISIERISFDEHIFNEYSSYLITGGLGGIGMEVAKWMAKSGAKYIVLVGRNPPSTRAEAIICEMRKDGVEVLVFQADVAELSQCKALLDQIVTVGFPPLKGIMHAAGVLSNDMIAQQSLESFDRVFRAKIKGTLNLHNLTTNSEYSLEYFVIFSSFACVIGGVGQANHSAASKFQDSFSQFRHSRGLPCTSINWGAWGEVGVAAELHTETMGVPRFSSTQGIAALERVLLMHKTNFVVADVNWSIARQTFNGGSFLEHIAESQNTKSSSTDAEKQIKRILEATSRDEKVELVRELVEDLIRDVLRLPSYESIHGEQDFRELGVDSLMAVEIRSRVQILLNDQNIRVLSLRDFQESRSINKLTNLLMSILTDANSSQPLSQEGLLELVKQDSVLPENVLAGLEFCDPPTAPFHLRKVLLTGVTGQLGPYILHYLLKCKSDLQVYCLIRADLLPHAEDRLQKRLSDFDLFDCIDMTNVTCILGDVGKPNLGMAEESYLELSENVDAVVHCAASVNLTIPYGNSSGDDLRTSNVTGLLNILRFCTTKKVKRLEFTSTIFSVTNINSDGTMPEDFPDDDDFGVQSLKVGYHLSKLVCEKLLKQAVANGVPVTVLRHNNLCGYSKSGIGNSSLIMFMHACRKIGLYPEFDRDHMITIVPVDLAADVSIQLLFNDNVQPGIYNIVTPKLVKLSQLRETFEGKGAGFKTVPYDEWRQAIVASQSAELLKVGLTKGSDMDMFQEHQLINALSSNGDKSDGDAAVLKLFETSERLKRCIPNIEEIMPDPIDLLKSQVTYYESTFQEDKLGPWLNAAAELGNGNDDVKVTY